MDKRIQQRAGMTLVEVVVAMAILALSVLSILALVDLAARTAARSDMMMRQAHVARREMERIKEHGYYSTALQPNIRHSLANADGYYDVVTSTNYVGAKDIHLVIQWTEPGSGSAARSLRLSTTVSAALHE